MANDARATGAERSADGDLFAATEGAGEKEIGDVDAGDEHDADDDAPEEKQSGFEARAECVLKERDGCDACAEQRT